MKTKQGTKIIGGKTKVENGLKNNKPSIKENCDIENKFSAKEPDQIEIPILNLIKDTSSVVKVESSPNFTKRSLLT